LVIAGSRPSAELKKIINDKPHIRLVADPDPATIYRLVREAQVNVLPTFQSTGIKLKLLAALFTGRHCLVNTPMVSGTGLEQLCVIKDDPDDFRNAVAGLLQQDYAATQQELRKSVLDRDFSNRKNAGKLAGMIFMD
jgi:glycosyltransferase involved in cell wall biosynthesis